MVGKIKTFIADLGFSIEKVSFVKRNIARLDPWNIIRVVLYIFYGVKKGLLRYGKTSFCLISDRFLN